MEEQLNDRLHSQSRQVAQLVAATAVNLYSTGRQPPRAVFGTMEATEEDCSSLQVMGDR